MNWKSEHLIVDQLPRRVLAGHHTAQTIHFINEVRLCRRSHGAIPDIQELSIETNHSQNLTVWRRQTVHSRLVQSIL